MTRISEQVKPARERTRPFASPALLTRGLALAIGLSLVGIHYYLGSLGSDVASPLAIFDRLFDLMLTSLIVISSLGIGRAVLDRIRWRGDSVMEEVVFAFGIGSGSLSLILLALGLFHLLYPAALLALLGVGIVLTLASSQRWLDEPRAAWARTPAFSRAERLLAVLLGIIMLPVLLGALTPAVEVDGLAYHLTAPALFLNQHALVASLENVGLNYPLGVDLLYMVGLAVGSDISAALVHFSFALALTVGIYALASRYTTRTVGLLAAFIFWTTAAIGLEASAPLLDLGWTFYEFLGVYAFLRWVDSHQSRELFLTGIALGLALSNKYIAGFGLIILLSLIALHTRRTATWRMVLKNVVAVGMIAGIVAFLWYLKNWVWLGNPVYPFFSGYYGLDGNLTKPLTSWEGLGLGNGLYNLLLFPYNVYAHWQYFGQPISRGGPSLFFLFLPLYLIVPKNRVINWLLVISLLRFAAWWPFTQSLRYLLVIFPEVCIVCAYTLHAFATRAPRRTLQFALGLLITGLCLVGIGLQWGFLFILRDGVLPFQVGAISRDAYLTANLLNYPATQFVNNRLPPTARILSIGEIRVYYVQRAMIPDDAHEQWPALVARYGTGAEIAKGLTMLGVTHIWVSEDDLTYARNYWHLLPAGTTEAQALGDFRSHYLTLLYQDERGYFVYALPPNSELSSP